MKIDEIRELIQLMEQSTLEELEFEQEGVRLSLKKPLSAPVQREGEANPSIPTDSFSNAAVTEQANQKQIGPETETAANDSLHEITSPMVGTFYQAPSPDAEPYVQVGDRVNEKTVVCIVEAMKLMNELEAEVEGEIVEVLVENGQLVEYGQPLFLVQT